MTYDRVVAVLSFYRRELNFREHWSMRGSTCRLCHCFGMIDEMLTWQPDRLPKMFRWLGFIQGVLWTEDIYTIREMKEHNRGTEPATETEQENSRHAEEISSQPDRHPSTHP